MTTPFTLNKTLQESDPVLYEIIQKEKGRQVGGLELIASENFTSRAVLDALGSCLTNKYSEGYPDHRYYGGNEFIDQVEILCQKRSLEAFGLKEEDWGVNVQPYSGSGANFAVYTALLQPHDRLMGLDLPSGGHLTHGYATGKKKVSASSIFWESIAYRVDPKTGLIDYDKMREVASYVRPKMLIAGASAYPREWKYDVMRQIADEHGAYLMADIAHIGGLVAAKQADDPFKFCDVVTTTTHKTLRGPRAALIFFKKRKEVTTKDGTTFQETDYESRINQIIFPGLQGGPHENTIAAIATAMKDVNSPEFTEYARQVRANAKALADFLVQKGYSLVTGGTDNHLLLWNLKPNKLTGSKLEKFYDMVNITANKNTVFGEVNAVSPSGLRLGSPALTSRGLKETDFVQIGEYLDRGLKIALEVQKSSKSSKLTDFVKACEGREDIKQLAQEVKAFAGKFPMPG